MGRKGVPATGDRPLYSAHGALARGRRSEQQIIESEAELCPIGRFCEGRGEYHMASLPNPSAPGLRLPALLLAGLLVLAGMAPDARADDLDGVAALLARGALEEASRRRAGSTPSLPASRRTRAPASCAPGSWSSSGAKARRWPSTAA
jgi:hypothetical protein